MSASDPARWAAPFHLDPGPDCPGVVNVLVEVPKRSRNKYELDKATGQLHLDRHLFSASHYPGDYGFVPGTYAGDGDPLDALVMLNEPTFGGCRIRARVVGLFRMTDDGKEDLKVLGVPASDPLFSEVRDLADVPAHFLREVEHFFATYKTLEGVHVEPGGWGDAAAARAAVTRAVAEYRARTAGGPAPDDTGATVPSASASPRERAPAAAARLYRVIVPVGDLARARAFYAEVLGTPGTPVSGGRHYFDCGGTILACFDPRGDGDGHDAVPLPDWVYLAVGDAGATRARCLAAGATPEPGDVGGAPAAEVARRPWGEDSFYVRDPFGNGLCFVQRGTEFTG